MNQSVSSGSPASSSQYDGHSTAMTVDMASNSSEHCRLNDNFGLLIQGILAAVAFSTLICE